MEENFNPVARTRANYYTPGSPVQFVCVELLRGDVSGENAVCLTFKNISRVTPVSYTHLMEASSISSMVMALRLRRAATGYSAQDVYKRQ